MPAHAFSTLDAARRARSNGPIWRPNASACDPLADDYAKMRGASHQMRYVGARSEEMPFADASFDIVTCFNELDHVDGLDATIVEIKRVTRPGGSFRVLVGINQAPTPITPIALRRDVLDRFAQEFRVTSSRACRLPDRNRTSYDALDPSVAPSPGDAALLVARLTRVET